jgi:hypothetical protein
LSLLGSIFIYLKTTIQKVTNFGHFANCGQEQRFELSNFNFGHAKEISHYYFIYIFYHVFLSFTVMAWQAKFVVGLRLKQSQGEVVHF